MPTQIPAQGIAPGAITADKIAAGAVTADKVAEGVAGGPKISTVAVTNNAYTVLDDTAVDTAGGYIKVTGSGFVTGCSVIIGTTAATSTTFISESEVRAQVSAASAGTYFVYVVNPDGGTATRVNGLTYSASPTWTTASALPNATSNVAYTQALVATSATSYALQAGSSLPSGMTLTSGGSLSGTTVVANTTSYSFTVVATDAENQDSPRTFSLDVIAPPAAGQEIYTTAGTYTFTVPAGVTSISAVLVGGGGPGNQVTPSNTGTAGGSGGGGGGLRYINSLPVTPGESLTVIVGAGGTPVGTYDGANAFVDGGSSYLKRSNDILVYAGGGSRGNYYSSGAGGGAGGTGSTIGSGTYGGTIGGGNGGSGGASGSGYAGGGGGAGGYSGAGGNGGVGQSNFGGAGLGQAGSGGGGSGGSNSTQYERAGGGGGVGLLGQGSSGAAPANRGESGKGGSGGNNGEWGTNTNIITGFGNGGLQGGGGGGSLQAGGIFQYGWNAGKDGGVRIIWGDGRAYPSTNTADV